MLIPSSPVHDSNNRRTLSSPRRARALVGVLAGLAVAAACLVAVHALSRPGTDDPASAPPAAAMAVPPAPAGGPLPMLLPTGAKAPPITATGWVPGEPSETEDRLIVLDIWASWCPYCRRTAPGLVRLYQAYRDRGVQFISLTDRPREAAEGFVQQFTVPWPNGYEASQTIADFGAMRRARAGTGPQTGASPYEVHPTVYLIGRDGLIRWCDGRGRERHQEPEAWLRGLEAALEEALRASPPVPTPGT